MKNILTFLFSLLSLGTIVSQTFETKSIFFSGEIDKRINFVILSDGYLESELSKFEVDANAFVTLLFNETPYKEYKNYFNVFIIKVPSIESGASHPGTATDVIEPYHPIKNVNNYFGSSFDNDGIHRSLAVTNKVAVSRVLAENFPFFDKTLILVNSPYYGGSGGTFPVASTSPESAEIAIHEMAHSFADLTDEYYPGDQFAREARNMTQETDPEKVKWKNWYNDMGIGIYQHCCGGNSALWYRPHNNCKMRVLGAPFCAVCTEVIVEKIHSIVKPIDSYSPTKEILEDISFPLEFKTNLVSLLDSTLRITWKLNDTILNITTPTLSLERENLSYGNNVLEVTVKDLSPLVRIEDYNSKNEQSLSWIIKNPPPEPILDDDDDGIVNAADQCPDTPIGQTVDENGCLVFSFDAFKVYTETASCPNTDNGLIKISTTEEAAGYDFDVKIDYNGKLTHYPKSLSINSQLSIAGLPSGTYSITISLDERDIRVFNRVFIDMFKDISAKIEIINPQAKVARYTVSGNNLYAVTVNTKTYEYAAKNSEEATILVNLEQGTNVISIKGLECQSIFKDVIALDEHKIYPNPVKNDFRITNGYSGKIMIYDAQGALAKEMNITNTSQNIDISELATGLYYVHFLESKIEILKIIKL